ncbi:MAG: cyclic pyranopterin monophosphate synthase MoaC, partial [Armatimonadetes bacterium]|nr:cyclic pyranopterin monophosphate synthase MoaC [Armatimonadota bacterium]
DISTKPDTHRVAIAEGMIRLRPATLDLIRRQEVAKGDVFTVAKVAGMMAAKQTAHLIPMCHPLLLTDVQVDLTERPDGVAIRAAVSTVGKTGAEMEALTAVSAAALTIYDMCKAVDRTMEIGEIRVAHKQGGKSSRAVVPEADPQVLQG